MAYTTEDYVYDKVGVTTDQISSAQMTRILEAADAEVDRIIKTTCEPHTTVEILNGNNLNYIYLKNLPLLSVSALEIEDTEISISKIRFYKNPAKICLLTNSEQTQFYTDTSLKNIRVKYSYGWLEETTTNTLTTGAEVAGSAVEIGVTAGGGANFTVNDWVRIVGFDGNEEVAKVTAQGDNSITCDLVLGHEAGTTIIKLQVPPIVKQLAGVIAAIMSATYMMGNTYTFATGYSVPDYSVQKGVPYPHFNRNMEVWVKERDFLMSQIPEWPVFA
ncbi:hypothetical protein K9M79_03060 [Candidatus Woesearchaeota archaeon]|nr:hypothetical protein [Candidatus Woesearchaeota archaeon]